jgi:hypothetical protein
MGDIPFTRCARRTSGKARADPPGDPDAPQRLPAGLAPDKRLALAPHGGAPGRVAPSRRAEMAQAPCPGTPSPGKARGPSAGSGRTVPTSGPRGVHR